MNGGLNTLRRRGWRDWLGALALLGLLTRAVVPVGFMPESTHGQLRLVLCSMHYGEQTLPDNPAPRESDHTSCPFALSAAAVAPPVWGNPAAPVLLKLARFFPSERSAPKSAPPRYAAARGPPVLA